MLFHTQGFTIYDVRTEGGEEGQKIPKFADIPYMNFADRGGRGGKKMQHFGGRHIWEPPHAPKGGQKRGHGPCPPQYGIIVACVLVHSAETMSDLWC